MFAIVEIAGRQYKAEPNTTLKAPTLQGEPGDSLKFDKVLLYENASDAAIGAPYVEGSVEAKILEHGKDDTVLVFHKKRRKGYRKLNGHRQGFTKIEFTKFNLPGFENVIAEKEPEPQSAPEEESLPKATPADVEAVSAKEEIAENETPIEAPVEEETKTEEATETETKKLVFDDDEISGEAERQEEEKESKPKLTFDDDEISKQDQ